MTLKLWTASMRVCSGPMGAPELETICHFLASVVCAGGSEQLPHDRIGSRGKVHLLPMCLCSDLGDTPSSEQKNPKHSRRGGMYRYVKVKTATFHHFIPFMHTFQSSK